MKVSEDQYIIEGLLQENLQIMKSLYEDFYPGILTFISSNNGTPEDAKDIFQDALVVIYLRAKKNPLFLHSRFNTFLFAVCKILWLKHQRRSFNFAYGTCIDEVEFSNLDNQILDDMIQMEKQKLVWRFFKQLGRECQQILQLSFDETPLEIITEIVGYSSVQYTKNRKTNCKNLLVRRIWNSLEYKELQNEKRRENTAIPRW